MKFRSVPRQEKNGTGLAQAADGQTVFTLDNTEGALAGFRLPDFAAKVNAPGWHLHYIDKARKHGGHVMNFALDHGELQGALCTRMNIRLPEDPAFYAGLDLGKDRAAERKKAEAER